MQIMSSFTFRVDNEGKKSDTKHASSSSTSKNKLSPFDSHFRPEAIVCSKKKLPDSSSVRQTSGSSQIEAKKVLDQQKILKRVEMNSNNNFSVESLIASTENGCINSSNCDTFSNSSGSKIPGQSKGPIASSSVLSSKTDANVFKVPRSVGPTAKSLKTSTSTSEKHHKSSLGSQESIPTQGVIEDERRESFEKPIPMSALLKMMNSTSPGEDSNDMWNQAIGNI